MGDVWEADDTVLSRTVAVKVLRPGTDEEEVFARRFRSEALYTANLCHPNIATVFDYGEDDNLAYLVMELVPGEPLSALVQREGALEPERVRAIMGQSALALGAAHEAGVVHRDVKPANILVMPDGTVKLTDFGIARAVDGSGHTQTGEVLGTPHYLSPEQALGERRDRCVRPLRARAWWRTSCSPAGGRSTRARRWRPPWRRSTTRPRRCPRTCRRACGRSSSSACEKQAANRPASARELGERLGVPEGDLPEATEDAADVVGTAAAAEESVDDRPAAPPRWTGGDGPDTHADERDGRAEGARPLGVGARLQRGPAGRRGRLVHARPLNLRVSALAISATTGALPARACPGARAGSTPLSRALRAGWGPSRRTGR